MPRTKPTALEKKRRAIDAACGAAALAGISIIMRVAFYPGGRHSPLNLQPSTLTCFAAIAGCAFVLIAVIRIRSALRRRIARPRCTACGALVSTTPRWEATSIHRCDSCGRARMVTGRP